jgi:hypothetical protein
MGERRFVHTAMLALPMTKRGRKIMVCGVALLTALLVALALAVKPSSLSTIVQPLFAIMLVGIVFAIEQELVIDQHGARLEHMIFPFRRRFVWRKVLWIDQPMVRSHRAMARRGSERYNLIVRIDKRKQRVALGVPFLFLVANQWVERGDDARFLALKRQQPWWRLAHSFPPFPAYSDAPQLFKLPDVLAEFGQAPTEVDARDALPGVIDTKKPAVAVSIGAGLVAAVAAILLATQSVWLYVDPSQGWTVAAVGGSFAAAIIVIACLVTGCDAASTVGAMFSGAIGFAFLAAIAMPDVSAVSEASQHRALFEPNGAAWVTNDASSPVRRLDEPPLRVKVQPTQVTVACGIAAICAFKRTDFESLR